MNTSRRRKLSSPKGIQWGFTLVIFFMVSLSTLLMISAGSRFSGVAWGSLLDWDQDVNVSLDGFMVVDLSEVEEVNLAANGFMYGAAYASQLNASAPEKESFAAPKEEPDASSVLSQAESADIDSELPSAAKFASLSLPVPLDEPLGDFGPLPQDLEDFESIILNTTEDGLKLPEDIDLPEMELPEDGIILTDVGVNWKEHVVKSGETLSDIAMMYGGITAQDILRANELKDANRLAAQHILLIPNSLERIEDTLEEVRIRKARVVALRERAEPIKIISYVVAAGDSLWSIANSQRLEVDTLVGSNAFKSSVLQPGAVLRIPNQDGIFYTVKKGDKIDNIAKKYQVAVDKIRKVNPTVDMYSLKASGEIFLPGARPEAIAETRTSAKKAGAGSAKKASVSAGKTSRSFRWPVMGRINSPFGWRRHPITRRSDFHTGLDIKASRGTVIRSARDGRVAYAGWMGGYGKVVVVEHASGQSTLYAHCSSILTKKGAKISAGQNIARAGSTGRATGPHLHFEIRNGNSPVNPLKYLK